MPPHARREGEGAKSVPRLGRSVGAKGAQGMRFGA